MLWDSFRADIVEKECLSCLMHYHLFIRKFFVYKCFRHFRYFSLRHLCVSNVCQRGLWLSYSWMWFPWMCWTVHECGGHTFCCYCSLPQLLVHVGVLGLRWQHFKAPISQKAWVTEGWETLNVNQATVRSIRVKITRSVWSSVHISIYRSVHSSMFPQDHTRQFLP